MDINGVKKYKYTSLSNVQRKLTKSNANDDKNGEDFDAINSRLKKKRLFEQLNPENAPEGAPDFNTLPKTPQIFSGQNTKPLSDPKEDSWRRASLFMEKK